MNVYKRVGVGATVTSVDRHRKRAAESKMTTSQKKIAGVDQILRDRSNELIDR